MDNPTSSQLLGIDVGGSGIKAALVDVDDARLVGGRHRIDRNRRRRRISPRSLRNSSSISPTAALSVAVSRL
jgi:predicted NBD/HSP70 family sugar kinase